MSAVATNRLHGSTAATEILVLEPIAQRMGLVPILLMPGEITIGSSPECQVQLTSPGVQPQHCTLKTARSRVSVRALDRRTWLNNLPVSEGWLRPGDRPAVGPVEFRVRHAEPWDVLPDPVESVDSPATEIARAVTKLPSEQEQVKSFESQLLRQIADLETEVARHQAAVTRLERRAIEESVQVVNPEPRPAATMDLAPDGPAPVSHPAFTVPRFLLSPVITSGIDEEHRRLYEELESHHHQARKQLAELSVRNDLLNRQCLELAAQWEQLRGLIAEQEAATVERSQREQQLYERERRCTFQESEIARRSQRLTEELDKVAARLLQLQAEADQLAGQTALLDEREQSLNEQSRRLDKREAEIEQATRTVEQREAASREANAAAEAWQQERETTEARWAQRDKELEVLAAQQLARAEVLTHREEACEQLTSEIRHDRHQLAADRAHLEGWNRELLELQTALTREQEQLDTLQRDLERREGELKQRETDGAELMASAQQQREHLAAEQARLEAWNAELTQSQTVFDQQQQELVVEASTLKAEAQEFMLREYAWEQIVSTTQRDQERIVAEQDRLEALRSDFVLRQSELTERQLELEERAASIESEAEQLTQREQSVSQAAAALQEEKDWLVKEGQRLETWSGVLSGREANLVVQEQEIATLSANWSSQIEELRQRKQTWEQTVAATELAEEQVLTERYRLEAAHDELMAQQAALARAQEELHARQKHWEEARRSEADASSSALTNDYAHIERQREELALAERELEQVEGSLDDWEAELQARDAELATRESELMQAEIECAWQQRESEWRGTQQSSPRDVVADEATEMLARVSEERDALATELFLASQSFAESTGHTTPDEAAAELRRQSEQLARDVEHHREQWKILSAERLAIESGRQELQQQQSHWQTERAILESNLEALRWQLADEKEAINAERNALRSRERQLETQLDELDSERAAMDLRASEIEERRVELLGQARALEEQQQELTVWQAEQSREVESQEATKAALENDLSAARATLEAEQERLRTALLKFQRERQAWEEERLAWDEQLAAEVGPESSESGSSNVMDVLSRLDNMVQTELDRDTQSDLTEDSSDPFEAIRARYGVTQSDVDREEFSDESVEPEVVEPGEHGTPRSLWDADTQDEVASESHAAVDLPATEEDLSVNSLRARLAEMFSMEMTGSKPAVEEEFDDSPQAYAADPAESNDTDTVEAEHYEPAPYAYQEPEVAPVSTDFAVEPVADEYDSVESYMQRLLDRNRKSRAGDEPTPERYVSKSTARTHTAPDAATAVSEFDDLVSEPKVAAEVVVEESHVPTVREPIDRVKMRAGLDSLRQVANISARHAIARSKWKKMRTTVALQALLTAIAGVVGMTIVTGKWLGMSGTDLWGWAALLIASGLAVKVFIDLRGIKHGERRTQRSRDESSASVPTPAASTSTSVEPGDEAMAP